MRSVLRRRVIDGITTALEQEQANYLNTLGVPTTPTLDTSPGRSPR